MPDERGKVRKGRKWRVKEEREGVKKYMMCTPAIWKQTAKLVMEGMQISVPWELRGRITLREAQGESCQPAAPCDLLANIQFNKKVLNIQKALKVS